MNYGISLWHSYRTGMAPGRGDDRDCEGCRCRHCSGSHGPSYRAVGGRLARGVPNRYKGPLYPALCPFSPRFTRSLILYLHEHGDCQGLFVTTWPQHRLYKRYIGVYISFFPWVKSKLCPSETNRYWRYSRDGAEGLDICMEWIRRLFVFSSEVIRLSE
jgi:hypothetical protein